LRIAGNFTAKHLPWYQDYSTLNEEEKYFVENANQQSNFRNGYFTWRGENRPSFNTPPQKMEHKYFIAVYTNEVKDYCDHQFFNNLYQISRGLPVFIVDNTIGDAYYNRLQNGCLQNGFTNFTIYHIDVPKHPKESQFQRNVCESVNFLRDVFLKQTDLPYFLIIESDVVSPVNLLNSFENSITRLNVEDPHWGIVGGLYYQGFHNYKFDSTHTSLERTAHCLSGCTVYKRALVEKYPFRFDPSNLGPFPDAWICYDSGKEYSLWNEHQIKCDHLHNPLNGLRVRSEASTDIPYLMPHQMEPFNGDTFIEQEFLRLRDQFNIDTVVETGTCFGGTTKFLGRHFKRVISIEINESYLQIARTHIGPLHNVHTYSGASEKILSNVLEREAPVNGNTMFYLDAHWDLHCPLQDELRIIGEHKIHPVIAIHDFHVPDEPGLAFDCWGDQPFTFDWLKSSFDNIYGAGGYDHYYNSALTSTEIKVGIIYITPRRSEMINLFINYYSDANAMRQMELDECLSRNVTNQKINKVYVVVDGGDVNFLKVDDANKTTIIVHPGRPTYADLFEYANSKNTGNDISIISNADIYFEERDVALINHLDENICYALSRWDKLPDGRLQLFDRSDSQDTWIFKGPIKKISNCDFTMGRPGCDNAVCHWISVAGYTIQNPARDIKAIHVHLSGERNYIPGDSIQTVPQPYKLIQPHNLVCIPGNWVTKIAGLSSPGQQSQYNEEAIIDHIFNHIGVTNQYFVDLGAGAYGTSNMSNTRKLKQAGWKGFGVDIRNKGEDWIIEKFITPSNILTILEEQNTPKEFDFLNLDIDSSDFWVLKQVLSVYSPRCICTEYNGTLVPDIPVVLKYEEGYTWDETNKYGYSFAAGKKLLEEHGYKIIYNMHNQNIFALKNELVKGFVFDVSAVQVQYHPENPQALWEVY